MSSFFRMLCLLSLLPSLNAAPDLPQTLLEHAGQSLAPHRLSESVLVIVDAQREYAEGRLPLVGMPEAVREISALLRRARAAGVPVVHVVHHGGRGGSLMDPAGPMVDIVPGLEPATGETVVAKHLPNSFAGTRLEEVLQAAGRRKLVVVGFMTHMCVSATVRAALDHGYRTVVVASACATRALPGHDGGIVPAAQVHAVELAALRDRFAIVVPGAADLPN